ncbi:hypothetical protein DRW03_31230 [Corallococcus sp. H22C18031201]|uniref:hypothetical protein n=1 Tax=Citreicoccus inhibens TaxID=2849499 RepID=UPI000E721B79|nr:hypothetical protein [Citreicoccus inhibens]MBJ6761071.1 hypothetical protein [Myxococcaceae bacterium JPH2]MBU8894421.1 hypothetical protein [Citreicoccus inhibens]RJS16200.1 hypothetical protein DRW03_31230 [Corallococcus sp. H22C18031201]
MEGLPGQDPGPQYVKPVSSLSPKYFEFLEQNSHIIYPAIAVLTLVIIAAGILQAWRTQDLDGLQKNQFKKAIVNELRRNISGLPGDVLAKAVGLDRLKTNRLLEQMQQEGMVLSHTNSQRLTVWRVRGAAPDANVRRA